MNRNRRNSSAFYSVVLLLLSAILVACAPAGGGGNNEGVGGAGGGGGAGGTPLQQLGINDIEVLQVGGDISISWENPPSSASSPTSYIINLRGYATADAGVLESDINITSDIMDNQARQNINIGSINLVDGRYYEIDIIVIGGDGEELLRTSLTANTALSGRIEYDGTPPSAPTMLAANSTGLTSLNISWDAPAPQDTPEFYRLERRAPDGAFRFISRVDNSALFHVDTDLMSSIAYDYRIAACRMTNSLPICSEYVIIMDARTDIDNDGISNDADNCPLVANMDQANLDGDAEGDVCDTDDDNDSVLDNADNCPLVANMDQANLDGDDNGDVCDTDDDNDMVLDADDTCPRGATGWTSDTNTDNDGDGCRDSDEDTDDDGDGAIDTADNCPLVANMDQANLDGDAEGDVCDTDDDNDMVLDADDDCPRGEAGWTSDTNTDNDGDGCRDSDEDTDDDNDSVLDTADNCPLVANMDQANLDGDADGDVCDTDDDNDSVLDTADNCPLVANMDQANIDGDNEGDACDNDTDNDMVDDDADNCPLVANMDQANIDGDDFGNVCDIDDDGDGLIELFNVTDLHAMRYNLAGTGLDLTNADNDNNAGGNSIGCGGMAGVSTCNGYELMQDIDLNDLIGESAPDGRTYRTENNWERIGSCVMGPLTGNALIRNLQLNARLCDTGAAGTEFFSGIFDGNGMTIGNLTMHIDNNNMNIGLAAGVSVIRSSGASDTILISSSENNTYSGVGFFGAVSSASVVRNINLENITIAADTGIRIYALGGLVGYGQGANIINSAVEVNDLTGAGFIGGMLGFGNSARITNAAVELDSIEGAGDNIGGLVGYGNGARITNASVEADSIEGAGDNIGGMLGLATGATINSASVELATIESSGNLVGGLIGEGQQATISSSSAIVATIESAGNSIGGLLGNAQQARISSSSAIVDTIESTSGNIGGLVGAGFVATIRSSLAIIDTIESAGSSIGSLLGSGAGATISNSLALSNEINGSRNVHQLVGGTANPTSAANSYWQDGVMASGTAFLTNVRGMSQSMTALQTPSAFTGIYEDWDDAWCDPATGAFITDSTNTLAIDANRAWDLGTGSEYPVISAACFGDRLSPQLQRTLIGRVLGETDLFPLP